VAEPVQQRWKRVLLIATAGVLVVALAGGLWLRSVVAPATSGDTVALAVPTGAGHAMIAALLDEKGIVTNARVFRAYLKLKGAGGFEAGRYEFRQRMSMGDAQAVLEKGPALPPARNVTIPEGRTVKEMAAIAHAKLARLSADKILTAVEGGQIRSKYQPTGKPLEGLLFPDTYRLEDGDDEADLVRSMVAAFDQTAGGLGYDQAQAKVGHTAYEAVIVASLVEAEAKADEDRAKIARVIYNRLDRGMTLGIDATFYYVLPPERKGRPLRVSDLERDTPYNTRKHPGLVPTPIMAPGKASLEAALNPEPGNWLFYVLKDERVHAFSETDAQFKRDVAAARAKGLLD
jgi:UPF0755 protein